MRVCVQAFNNLVQYQFEGNQHLVYCIIRRRSLFYELSALTLPRSGQQQQQGVEEEEQREEVEQQQRRVWRGAEWRR